MPTNSNNTVDRPLNHRDYYRLPWTLTDHIISWLEPTKKCNINCEGCYSFNNPTSHKTLQQIKEELDVIRKYRNTHTVSITGGEPLTHSQIEEIIRLVADRGYLPLLTTNGLALTSQMLTKFKNAGLKGVRLHIDSRQKRPGWTGKTELELNELRLAYAKMVASVKGISCGFNTTVYEDTLKYVPELLKWAEKHIDLVHLMAFIAFRAFWEAEPKGQFEYHAKGKKVEMTADLVYENKKSMRTDITSREIVQEIRKKYPDFEPCAYLGGTEEPDALKWLFALRIGQKDGIYGYLGPKSMEMSQVYHHFFHGKYFGHMRPWLHAKAKWMFLASLVDKNTANAFKRYFKICLKNPLKLLPAVHLQTVTIVQPPDILADGRQSMCDGCPDITVWNGRLVWSCRLEELMRYGCFLTLVPTKAKHPPKIKNDDTDLK